MLKKTITYKTFDDTEVTEDFYFNLTEAEVLKMEVRAPGNSFAEMLQNIVKSNNGQLIMDTFENFILAAYGEKSEDGKYFLKSPEKTEMFKSTNAYSQFFMEICLNSGAAADFVNGIMPKDMDKIKIEGVPVNKLELPEGQQAEDTRPAWVREDREPTKEELKSMTPDQLREAFARKASS